MLLRNRIHLIFQIASYSLCILGIQSTAQDEKTPDAQSDAGSLIKQAYEQSNNAATKAEFTQSIELCDRGLSLKISSAQEKYLKSLKSWALLSRARLYPIEKKPDPSKTDSPSLLAIKDCSLAIDADAGNWKAWGHRAKRYSLLGQTAKAIADLDSAIRKNPGGANLWFNRAELFFAQKDFEVAVTDYTEALKLEPNDVQALTGRAHCYVRLNKDALALDDYNQVIEKTSKSATAFLNRAELHMKMKDLKSAGEDYRAALTRDQSLAAAYRGVSWLYSSSGNDNYFNPTIADRAVKKAIELDGRETTKNLVVLAGAQAAAGEYSMARDTIKRVTASKSLSPDVQAKLQILQNRKWFIAGTGKK